MTMVSLKDIAAACGVSASTVSKALNDLDDISEKRKAMIRQKANEMGYLPNMAARALKTKMTHNIGVLFIDDYHSGLTHPYFAPVLESLKTEVENLGYDITFINKNVGGREMSYLEHCRYRNVDGVVIANVDFTKEEVVELVESDIPVVTIDHVFNNCPAVVSDNIKGVRELTEYVISMGHKKLRTYMVSKTVLPRCAWQVFIAPWRNMDCQCQMNMCQRHHILRERQVQRQRRSFLH